MTENPIFKLSPEVLSRLNRLIEDKAILTEIRTFLSREGCRATNKQIQEYRDSKPSPIVEVITPTTPVNVPLTGQYGDLVESDDIFECGEILYRQAVAQLERVEQLAIDTGSLRVEHLACALRREVYSYLTCHQLWLDKQRMLKAGTWDNNPDAFLIKDYLA